MYEPVIKWTGSKRSQAEEIISHFPKQMDTYYEPFIGGGSILNRLLTSGRKIKRYVCSDINSDLINLWISIRDRPADVFRHYRDLWNELTSKESVTEKSEFYNMIRDRYNENHDPLDFMFIMRTCFNGMPRYNREGKFNNPYHLNRDGINPSRFRGIIDEWAYVIKNVDFICQSYDAIVPGENDFVYMDPPYFNTKSMYFGGIDINDYFDFLSNLKCGYAVSFDGKSGGIDRTFDFPEELYTEHFYVKNGVSSFRRINNQGAQMVYESLYVKKHCWSD